MKGKSGHESRGQTGRCRIPWASHLACFSGLTGFLVSSTMLSPQPLHQIVSELDPDVVSDSEWRSIWQIVPDVTAPAWSPVHDVMVQASR